MACEIIVVGASLGGMSALKILLSGLSKTFFTPLVIVQHRLSQPQDGLVTYLQKWCALPVTEPNDKEPIVNKHVYLAPADYHLLLERRGTFSLSTEAAVLCARPSIDVLFESAADVYGASGVGVILTGASEDGAQGLAKVKAAGGITVVEDPATAQCSIMPQAALNIVAADHVLSIEQIVPFLTTLCRRAPLRKQRVQRA